ncbi:MAG: hypothetical protein ACLSAF_19870 [Intestinimonas sp.]
MVDRGGVESCPRPRPCTTSWRPCHNPYVDFEQVHTMANGIARELLAE